MRQLIRFMKFTVYTCIVSAIIMLVFLGYTQIINPLRGRQEGTIPTPVNRAAIEDIDAHNEIEVSTVQIDDSIPVENEDVSDKALGTGLEMPQVESLFEPDSDIVQETPYPGAASYKVLKWDVYGNPLPDDFLFYRQQLTQDERTAYDIIYYNARLRNPSFEMTVQVRQDAIFDIFCAVMYDNPDLYWLDAGIEFSYNQNNIVTRLTLLFNEAAQNFDAYNDSFRKCTDSVLEYAMLLDGDAAKVKFIHDLLTNINTYRIDAAMGQTAYSAIVNGESVCAGYTAAFQYYMQRLGIPCAFVTGETKENHAWNLVKLDEDYYNIDVTWNDPLDNPPSQYYYNYFNITDEQIAKDHTRSTFSAGLPTATGTRYQYPEYYGHSPGSDFSFIDYGHPNPGIMLFPVYGHLEAE